MSILFAFNASNVTSTITGDGRYDVSSQIWVGTHEAIADDGCENRITYTTMTDTCDNACSNILGDKEWLIYSSLQGGSFPFITCKCYICTRSDLD